MDIPINQAIQGISLENVVKGIGASLFVIQVNPLKVQWHNQQPELQAIVDQKLKDLIDLQQDLSSMLLDHPDAVEIVTGVIARLHLHPNTPVSGVYRVTDKTRGDCWLLYAAKVLSLTKAQEPDQISCILLHLNDVFKDAQHIDDFTRHISHEVHRHNIESLTDRQKEVLILFGQGKGRKEIASILNLSIYTIEDHKQALYRKFNCNSTSQLASFAQRIGILS